MSESNPHRWPDPNEPGLLRPKKAGRAHDTGSPGSPPLLVTHGKPTTLTHTSLPRDSNIPGGPYLGRGGTVAGRGAAVDLCIMYTECANMWESK